MLLPAHAPAPPGRRLPPPESIGGGTLSSPARAAGVPVHRARRYEGFLLLTIFGPTGGGLLGDFVRDFQLCATAATRAPAAISWLAVSVMMLEPLFHRRRGRAAVATGLRPAGPLARLAHPRPRAATGLGVITACVAGLVLYARADAARVVALPPFPGERIRVRLALPDTAFVDQKNTPFRFADLRAGGARHRRLRHLHHRLPGDFPRVAEDPRRAARGRGART